MGRQCCLKWRWDKWLRSDQYHTETDIFEKDQNTEKFLAESAMTWAAVELLLFLLLSTEARFAIPLICILLIVHITHIAEFWSIISTVFLTLFNKPLTPHRPHPPLVWTFGSKFCMNICCDKKWTKQSVQGVPKKVQGRIFEVWQLWALSGPESGHFLAQSAQKCQQVSRESKSAQNGQKMPRVKKFYLQLFWDTL